jgi:predicted Zn-dependent protease
MAEPFYPTPHRPRRPVLTPWGAALCFLTILAVLIALGCAGGQQPGGQGQGEGPGHRPQRLALSPQQELELGRRAFREVLSDPEKYGRVVPADSEVSRRIRGIAERLIRATEIEPLMREMNLSAGGHRYRYEWEVAVLDRNEANAFCLPAGKICVFTGILRITRNDDQIATVLGHEMAHALAHHVSERLARREEGQGVFGALQAKAFDRAQESEADHIGLFLMTFAGYDPEEALRFWERMRQMTQDQQRPPELLSDHPSDAHRIADIKKWVPYAQAAKKAYDEGNIAPAGH